MSPVSQYFILKNELNFDGDTASAHLDNNNNYQ